MIEVKLFYQDKILTGIECKGHSGYSEKGSDIICAAVSVLMQALLLGLSEVAKIDGIKYRADNKIPVISIKWPSKVHENISLLINTVSESLKQIALENPDYVKIISEVKNNHDVKI